VRGVRPNRVFKVAEIVDDVGVGAKFSRLAALGWLSCTYQAGEVGAEMPTSMGELQCDVPFQPDYVRLPPESGPSRWRRRRPDDDPKQPFGLIEA
jgi:hypothetical protein